MSNQRTFVILGKNGDLISFLPLLRAQPERPAIMVATEYLPLLEGVSYVDVIEFRGRCDELRRAVDEARKLSSDVRVCSIIGSTQDVKEFAYNSVGKDCATTDAFDKEAWKLAGQLKLWYQNLPLIFDKRDLEREAWLYSSLNIPANKKLILVSCGGQTSPFKYKKLLMHLLETRFRKGYHILDLDEIQAERFYDLIALYEKAFCLVATDSAPLHLANAVQSLPVVALVNDKPHLWNGSSWKPQHILHVRYSDFASRATEVIEAIKGIKPTQGMGDKVLQIWNAYDEQRENPGMEPPWFTMRIEPKMFGRDSKVAVKDDGRYPFLKDAIRAAAMKCGDNDVICLTKPDTIFCGDITTALMSLTTPAYHHRRIHMDGQDQHYPAVDLFAFTKAFWNEHSKELPDFIWGNDWYWNRAMLGLLRKYGAVELDGLIYCAPKVTSSNPNSGTQRRGYNEQLYQKARTALGDFMHHPRVIDQLPTMRLNQQGLKPYGYNPSIIRFHDKLLMAYRWHEDGTPASKLRLAELNEGGDVVSDLPIQCSGQSKEDARLFIHRGELWMSWVDSQYPHALKSTVKYGRLALGNQPAVENSIQLDYGNNDGESTQKNWLHFDHDGQLFCWYDCKTLLRIESGKVVEETVIEEPRWKFGEIRGGTTPLPYKGKLLRFFHSSTRNGPRPYPWQYFCGAMLHEPEPPFNVIAVSSRPILRGTELDGLSAERKAQCSHHKPLIVFPAGAVEHGDGWALSVGVNDCESVLSIVKPENLYL